MTSLQRALAHFCASMTEAKVVNGVSAQMWLCCVCFIGLFIGKQGLGRVVFEKETAVQKKQDEVKTVATFVQNRQKHFDDRQLKQDLWRSQLSCQAAT